MTDTPRPQHLVALDRANYVRKRRGEVGRALRGGDLSPVDAILGRLDDGDADEIVGGMPLRDVLQTVHRVQPADRDLGGLNAQRRVRVVEILRSVAPWVDGETAAA